MLRRNEKRDADRAGDEVLVGGAVVREAVAELDAEERNPGQERRGDRGVGAVVAHAAAAAR